MRGGPLAVINRQLRRLHMPPRPHRPRRCSRARRWRSCGCRCRSATPRSRRTTRATGGRACGYVDWVGTTWYSMYKASAGDGPDATTTRCGGASRSRSPSGASGAATTPASCASSSASCARTARVRMAVYYQSAMLKPEFRLSTHPLARAALRRALRWRRMTGVAPSSEALGHAAQALRARSASSARRKRGHDGRVELRAGAALELGAGGRLAERGAVAAVGGHRLVGVGDREDARLDRDLRPRAGRAGSRGRRGARGERGSTRAGRRTRGATGGARRSRDACTSPATRSASSGPGFVSTRSEMPILPMSWSTPASRTRSTRSSSRPSSRAISSA